VAHVRAERRAHALGSLQLRVRVRVEVRIRVRVRVRVGVGVDRRHAVRAREPK